MVRGAVAADVLESDSPTTNALVGRNVDEDLTDTGDHYTPLISVNRGRVDRISLEQPVFQCAVRAWRTDEGLPDNRVQAISQTPDGYLWIGTGRGLAKFDGVHFTTYDLKNILGDKGASVTCLCVDRGGGLWIGSDGGGLAVLKNDTVTCFAKSNGLAGDTMRSIYEAKDGSIWLATRTGVTHYWDGRFINYSEKEGLLSSIVRDLQEDNDGNLWIATGKGLNRLQGKKLTAFTRDNGLPNDSIRAICQDARGKIWIGSDGGLVLQDGEAFRSYDLRAGIPDNFVSALCDDPDGCLWVGTYSGLSRFQDGKFSTVLNNEAMPFDRINTLFKDHEGNLWVGSKEGLARVRANCFTTYTKREGLTYDNIISVMQDHAGKFWIGTWGGGMNQMADETLKVFRRAEGLHYSLILSSCEARDGSMWIGADYSGGLARFKDGIYTYYTRKDGMPEGAVRVIHDGPDGSLWVGTSGGLCSLKDGKFTVYTTAQHLAGNIVRCLCEDHAGNLWIGTETGLSRWKNGRFENFTTKEGLSDNTIIALYEDRDNNLWIGTGTGGLNRYRDGVFKNYTMKQGMYSDEVFEILEGEHGWLWLSCSTGVFRVNKRDLNALDDGETNNIVSIGYGKDDGMASTLCNGVAKPAGWKSQSGTLWFPTSKGLISVDPKTVKINLQPPPVYIEQLIANKKQALGASPLDQEWAPGGRANFSHYTVADSPVRIQPGRGDLEFHYTALDLQKPDQIRFKYELEGIDTEWVDAGSRRAAYYNNLPTGTYHFRVLARNPDGVWNESGASLTVILLPQFWQTWWFRWLAVIGFALLFAGALRFNRERRREIEGLRMRIAADLHDDVGSSLSTISLLTRLLQKNAIREDEIRDLATIHRISTHTSNSVRDIVWFINPEFDTMEDLLMRMKDIAGTMLTGIEWRFEAQCKDLTQQLALDFRQNVFLMFKEILTNVVRHSGAAHVEISVTHSRDIWELCVRDDGAGFDSESKPGGNGVKNLRRRAEKLKGVLELNSRPNSGTVVSFSTRL